MDKTNEIEETAVGQSPPEPVELKRAVTRRQRGPHTYDFLAEIEGAENVVFGFDELSDEAIENLQEVERANYARRREISLLIEDETDADKVNELVAEQNKLARELTVHYDGVLRQYLKGEGSDQKVFWLPEDERTNYSRATRADLVALFVQRSANDTGDYAFLSKPSRR